MGHFTIIVAASHLHFGSLSAPSAIQQGAHMFIHSPILFPHRSITILHCTTDTSVAWATPSISRHRIAAIISRRLRKMAQSQ
jgi:hypothetical protein